jgi:uncharacterized protein YecT (DUF1311 family)
MTEAIKPARRGVGLGITSLVFGILAALGALASLGSVSSANFRIDIFFTVLSLAFGIGSTLQSSRPGSMATSGLLLSLCSAAFLGFSYYSGNVTTQAVTSSAPVQAADPQSNASWTPSYDCNNVESGPERMICANPVLSKLDVQLNETYTSAKQRVTDREDLKADQASWLRNVRNKCSDSDCMSTAYRARIAALEAK